MPQSASSRGWSLRPHPHLYEINTWAWLEELSSREHTTVTLATVPEEEWDKLRSLGFDLVWLMGVWKRSPAGRRIVRTDSSAFAAYDTALPGWTINDLVGSPYSIQAYDPDPRLGSWDDLDSVRKKLHARHMGLILDFVPNHTAPDHAWVQAHPEYYIQGTLGDFRRDPPAFFLAEQGDSARFIAHGKDPYFPPWPDTAQLNYYNPAAREVMVDVLRRLAQHCDGARCDMAMLSLNDVFSKTWGPFLSGFHAPGDEFWPAAFAAIPGFIWIAEVYWDMERRLQQLGFNFTYDKQFYDLLLDGPPPGVRDHLAGDVSYQRRLARFLENHDERRSAAAFGKARLPAAATLAATLPGMRFYHLGQLEGRNLRLPIQLRRAAPEPLYPQIQELYQKLLAISGEAVFHDGEWKLLEVRPAGDPSFENIIAGQWRMGRSLKVVAVNLGSSRSQGSILLGPRADASATYKARDQLSDQNYTWRGPELAQNGARVTLEPYQGAIFDLSPA